MSLADYSTPITGITRSTGKAVWLSPERAVALDAQLRTLDEHRRAAWSEIRRFAMPGTEAQEGDRG